MNTARVSASIAPVCCASFDELRRQMRPADRGTCGKVLDQAIKAVKDLDIPHLELIEVGDEIIH